MKALGAIALTACAGRAPSVPAPLEHASMSTLPSASAREVEPPPPSMQAAPRPAVDVASLVADPTEYGRWPLAIDTHPQLEPHFDVVAALAQPGIGWVELCQRGAQNRHLSRDQDLVAYLAAWCSVAKHDVDDALFRLGQLRGSTIRGVADAIRFDVANIVVDHGPSNGVEAALTKSQLATREIVDLIAAGYFDVGSSDDAFAMNKLAIDLDRAPSDDARCHRLVRGIIAGGQYRRDELVAELHDLVEWFDPRSSHASATCRELDAEIQCWHDPAHACTGWRGELLAAYHAWPSGPAPARAWLRVAWHALGASSRGVVLLVPAFELALETSDCDPEVLIQLSRIADRARALPEDYRDKFKDEYAQTLLLQSEDRETCSNAIARRRGQP